MTDRKPPRVRFETWIDKQIREAQERGEFENLPGAGRPIADLDTAHDELWWVKDKLRRENISYLPPSLALRKEAEDARKQAMAATTEAEVRRHIAAINEKIIDATRKPLSGPPLNLAPIDVERFVAAWRQSGKPEA